jgi:hypothetical protein
MHAPRQPLPLPFPPVSFTLAVAESDAGGGGGGGGSSSSYNALPLPFSQTSAFDSSRDMASTHSAWAVLHNSGTDAPPLAAAAATQPHACVDHSSHPPLLSSPHNLLQHPPQSPRCTPSPLSCSRGCSPPPPLTQPPLYFLPLPPPPLSLLSSRPTTPWSCGAAGSPRLLQPRTIAPPSLRHLLPLLTPCPPASSQAKLFPL